jgi:hypothetical protein
MTFSKRILQAHAQKSTDEKKPAEAGRGVAGQSLVQNSFSETFEGIQAKV